MAGLDNREHHQDHEDDSDDLFRAVFEQVGVGVVVCDPSGRLLHANAAFHELCGHRSEKSETVDLLNITHVRQSPDHHEALQQLLRGDLTRYQMDTRCTRKDGDEVWVSLILSPRRVEGRIAGLLAVVKDITRRQRSRERITEALHEKDTLLREVHHRVKNNLQLVSSLLGLQERRSPPGPVQDALRQNARRVGAMALVHQKIYGAQDMGRVRFLPYARDLVAAIRMSFDEDLDRITVTCSGEDLTVLPERAIPLGLILTELTSNAFKHAFPGGKTGTINITLTRENDSHALCVVDDGVGAQPRDSEHRTLGLQLVASLVEQLGASMTTSELPGTRVTIHLPNPSPD